MALVSGLTPWHRGQRGAAVCLQIYLYPCPWSAPLRFPWVTWLQVPFARSLDLTARMPGESYRRRLGSLLLYLCYVFRALINSLVC